MIVEPTDNVQSSSQLVTLSWDQARLPESEPPEYAAVQRPTTTLQYTFSQLGFNSMVLVPPETAQDTRPQYYICTNMNVFMPLAYVTSVFRGANEYGEKIGEFEMGIINTPAKLHMKSLTCSVNSALGKFSGGRSDGIWDWTPTGRHKDFKLRWNYTLRPAKCIALGSGHVHLASFTFPSRLDVNLYNRSKLEVTVEGQNYFDHILMSLLIIERKRLTPGVDQSVKQLFN